MSEFEYHFRSSGGHISLAGFSIFIFCWAMVLALVEVSGIDHRGPPGYYSHEIVREWADLIPLTSFYFTVPMMIAGTWRWRQQRRNYVTDGPVVTAFVACNSIAVFTALGVIPI